MKWSLIMPVKAALGISLTMALCWGTVRSLAAEGAPAFSCHLSDSAVAGPSVGSQCAVRAQVKGGEITLHGKLEEVAPLWIRLNVSAEAPSEIAKAVFFDKPFSGGNTAERHVVWMPRDQLLFLTMMDEESGREPWSSAWLQRMNELGDLSSRASEDTAAQLGLLEGERLDATVSTAEEKKTKEFRDASIYLGIARRLSALTGMVRALHHSSPSEGKTDAPESSEGSDLLSIAESTMAMEWPLPGERCVVTIDQGSRESKLTGRLEAIEPYWLKIDVETDDRPLAAQWLPGREATSLRRMIWIPRDRVAHVEVLGEEKEPSIRRPAPAVFLAKTGGVSAR